MITPDDYREASFFAREIAKEMLNRLEWIKLNPKQIIDVGCGIGADTQALALHYPEAAVYGIDQQQAFLEYGKSQKSRTSWLAADCCNLPFRSQSVDLIFANLLLPWIKNPALVLREWRRILRPEGLIFFSCLGPDTFKEWQLVGNTALLPQLIDMHHIGDALLEAGFSDPVLEVENLTFTYRSKEQCQQELEKSGIWPEEESIDAQLLAVHETRFPVTFEVIYAHAFCPAVKGFKPDEEGLVRIPVGELRALAQK